MRLDRKRNRIDTIRVDKRRNGMAKRRPDYIVKITTIIFYGGEVYGD